MGVFIIAKAPDGGYVFNLRSDNGETLLMSESYVARGGCLNGVEAVQFNAHDGKRYKRRVSDEGGHYFVLTAANGKIVATSGLFKDESACETGIAVVRRAVKGAEVYERLG